MYVYDKNGNNREIIKSALYDDFRVIRREVTDISEDTTYMTVDYNYTNQLLLVY